MIVNALAGLREHGAELVRTFSLPLVADSFLKSNQVDRGLEFIEETFASMDSTGARIQEAETHRIRGELLLSKGEAHSARRKTASSARSR